MALIRSLLARRQFAVLIWVAALAIRVLVPGGYMLSADRGHVTIEICSGVAGQTMTMMMPGDMPGDHAPEPHGAVEMPCAFAGLSHQAMAAADPVLLLAAIAFVIALGTAPAPPRLVSPVPHLRPPLRGPPATF